MKKKILEAFVRYTLIILLIYNFYGSIFVLLSNQEIYFFGEKLTGLIAIFYSLIIGASVSVTVYFLFKEKHKREILALIYFAYFFIENLITNASLGFGFSASPLAKMGLITSIVLLIFRKMIYR